MSDQDPYQSARGDAFEESEFMQSAAPVEAAPLEAAPLEPGMAPAPKHHYQFPWWLKPLTNIDQPMWKYILKMWAISFGGAILIAAALSPFINDKGIAKELTPAGVPPFIMFLSIIAVAPIVETFMLSAGLKIISFYTKRPVRLAAVSAIVWACIHSTQVPAWGLMVAWPFFVFSVAYLAWRRRGWLKAMAVAMGIHAVHNFIPAVFLFLGQVF